APGRVRRSTSPFSTRPPSWTPCLATSRHSRQHGATCGRLLGEMWPQSAGCPPPVPARHRVREPCAHRTNSLPWPARGPRVGTIIWVGRNASDLSPTLMEERRAMRIAVVVHNEVKRDARVLKGVASLKAHGHEVRLFGLTAEESEDFVLPNGVPVHLQHRDLTGVRARVVAEGLERGRESSIWTSFRTQGDLVF